MSSKPSSHETDIIDCDLPVPRGRPCEACGAPVERDDQYCPACGTLVPAARQLPSGGETAEPWRSFSCKNCGAQVFSEADRRSYVCPFCDSTYVVELDAARTGRQRPEFVIGFAVTPEEAGKTFRKWIAENAWFRPGDLRLSALLEKQKGVYLPFWHFSMLARSRWSAVIGEYWYRTETYTTKDAQGKTVTRTRQVQETEWWPLSGKHHAYYAGYLVSGSTGLPQAEAERIKPFDLPALKRYQPFFLAGWMCEEYSIAAAEALQVCQEEFARREREEIGRFLPGDTHRNLDATTGFAHVNSDLCLLPVYILSYRYKDTLYRFLVNGQTGRSAGDKPVSYRRITAAVVVALAVIAALVATVLVLQR